MAITCGAWAWPAVSMYTTGGCMGGGAAGQRRDVRRAAAPLLHGWGLGRGRAYRRRITTPPTTTSVAGGVPPPHCPSPCRVCGGRSLGLGLGLSGRSLGLGLGLSGRSLGLGLGLSGRSLGLGLGLSGRSLGLGLGLSGRSYRRRIVHRRAGRAAEGGDVAQELRQLGHGGVGEDHHAGARGAEQRRAQQQQPG
eukprot:scaffold24623_cov66-Phaeocystis_antarctica.AAC.3